jgi:1,4-dihydroxy-2-naphthoate polyprenyltransferase
MLIKIANFGKLIWSFIKLTRVVFLFGGFLLYALGAAMACRMGLAINWTSYWFGQVVVTSIQLMGQYLNEYYDLEVDRLAANNRTWFSGGSGILAEGGIAPSAVLLAARVCAAIGLVTGLLASLRSIWMIPIISLCLLGSWFYSSPPLALMSSGWGELTTSLIVALLVPLAGFAMQGGFPTGQLWLICIPLVLVHIAMLMSFEVPDHDADLSVGKKTLTVRLGLRGAAWMITGLILSAYLFWGILIFTSNFPARWMAFAAPLAVWQMLMVHRVTHLSTHPRFNLLTTGGIGLFALMAILALVGVIFAA